MPKNRPSTSNKKRQEQQEHKRKTKQKTKQQQKNDFNRKQDEILERDDVDDNDALPVLLRFLLVSTYSSLIQSVPV